MEADLLVTQRWRVMDEIPLFSGESAEDLARKARGDHLTPESQTWQEIWHQATKRKGYQNSGVLAKKEFGWDPNTHPFWGNYTTWKPDDPIIRWKLICWARGPQKPEE